MRMSPFAPSATALSPPPQASAPVPNPSRPDPDSPHTPAHAESGDELLDGFDFRFEDDDDEEEEEDENEDEQDEDEDGEEEVMLQPEMLRPFLCACIAQVIESARTYRTVPAPSPGGAGGTGSVRETAGAAAEDGEVRSWGVLKCFGDARFGVFSDSAPVLRPGVCVFCFFFRVQSQNRPILLVHLPFISKTAVCPPASVVFLLVLAFTPVIPTDCKCRAPNFHPPPTRVGLAVAILHSGTFLISALPW